MNRIAPSISPAIQREKSQKDGCPVCLKGFGRFRKAYRTECKHAFHTGCLKKALKIQKKLAGRTTCPLCRTSMAKQAQAWGIGLRERGVMVRVEAVLARLREWALSVRFGPVFVAREREMAEAMEAILMEWIMNSSRFGFGSAEQEEEMTTKVVKDLKREKDDAACAIRKGTSGMALKRELALNRELMRTLKWTIQKTIQRALQGEL